MEYMINNIESIIVALALIANFIITISKKGTKWINPKLESLITEVQSNRRYTLLALIYTKEAPVLSRILALLEYMKLGFNHDAIEYSAKEFIVNNQQLFWTVVNETKNHPIKDKENYENCIGRIKEILK